MDRDILLIEAESRSRRVLGVSLRRAKFNVRTADSGAAALTQLEANAPEVIVCNTGLPDIDGIELCRRVRANPATADVHFIFLSDDHSAEKRQQGIDAGANDFLTKPVFVGELLAKIGARMKGLTVEPTDAASFSGELSQVGVLQVLLILELGGRSGACRFASSTGKEATIYVHQGQIIDAALGTLRGALAVHRLLRWTEGRFEIEFGDVEGHRVISQPTRETVMDGFAKIDALGSLESALGDLDNVFFVVEYEALGDRLMELEADVPNVVCLFDGRRSLLDVVDDSPLDLEQTRDIIQTLLEIEVLSQIPPPVATATEADEPGVAPEQEAVTSGSFIARRSHTEADDATPPSASPGASVMVDWGVVDESQQLRQWEAQRRADSAIEASPVRSPRPFGSARRQRSAPSTKGLSLVIGWLCASTLGLALLHLTKILGQPSGLVLALLDQPGWLDRPPLAVLLLQGGTAVDLVLQGTLLLGAIVGLLRHRAYGYAMALCQMGIALYWSLSAIVRQCLSVAVTSAPLTSPAAVTLLSIYALLTIAVTVVLYRQRAAFTTR